VIVQPPRAFVFKADELLDLKAWVLNKRSAMRSVPDFGTIAFTNGCFDILHAGHVHLLQSAACTYGDVVIVGVNTDEGVRQLKGPDRPYMSYEDRVFLVSSLRFVDVVVGFEENPYELIVAIEPDVLIKGAEYAEDDIIGSEIVKARGGKVVRFPMIRDLSTTQIAERLKAR
jgi:D-beta-D-heptose 7-phosphate kinase/D-beta-D-heptose 1-phosphate adenosyltransferase